MTNNELGILKAEVLQRKYGKYADAWSERLDDRRLVKPILNQMLGACDALRSIEDNYCHVAINKAITADSETLDEIIGFFTGVTQRGNGYIKVPEPVI